MHMASQTKQWTLEEVHSLPDDGNKYELIDGELFVTPAPSELHETVVARLNLVLVPFVVSQGLGLVYHARAVLRHERSEVEPDIMVRQPRTGVYRDWDDAPIPSLVVEVLSRSTRRRDHEHKRRYYLRAGVPEYWIVDPQGRSIRVARPDASDVSDESDMFHPSDEVVTERLVWSPSGASGSLTIDAAALFES